MVHKYAVCTRTLETKDGCDALYHYENLVDQDPDTELEFDSYNEAKAFYDTIQTRVDYNPYHRIYVHSCKWIAENVYDTELEFAYENGWWDKDFPNYENEEE